MALVSANRELQERLRAAFKGDQRYEFCAIDGAAGAVSPPHFDPAAGPSVLIADLDDDPAGAIAAIENLRRQRFEGPIVAISDTLDEARRARPAALAHCRLAARQRAGPSEIVAGVRAGADGQSGGRNRASRSSASPSFPPRAGSATTTLAIQTGIPAGAARPQLQVDMPGRPQFPVGRAGRLSGSDSRASRSARWRDAPERLDAQLLEVMLSRHETRVAVLAAAARADRVRAHRCQRGDARCWASRPRCSTL